MLPTRKYQRDSTSPSPQGSSEKCRSMTKTTPKQMSRRTTPSPISRATFFFSIGRRRLLFFHKTRPLVLCRVKPELLKRHIEESRELLTIIRARVCLASFPPSNRERTGAYGLCDIFQCPIPRVACFSELFVWPMFFHGSSPQKPGRSRIQRGDDPEGPSRKTIPK